ncbi:hypothetical protein NDU88_000457 [Pleurodeles waltl]|uniref:Uncharacterized protein n=1 Tax=Pleurodeles waltl TaxID=8319 RepID=A0AAV7VXJ9_PLEWA|nr:hypothetical protein NDU88_000457 [Pleurodeles waltl]
MGGTAFFKKQTRGGAPEGSTGLLKRGLPGTKASTGDRAAKEKKTSRGPTTPSTPEDHREGTAHQSDATLQPWRLPRPKTRHVGTAHRSDATLRPQPPGQKRRSHHWPSDQRKGSPVNGPRLFRLTAGFNSAGSERIGRSWSRARFAARDRGATPPPHRLSFPPFAAGHAKGSPVLGHVCFFLAAGFSTAGPEHMHWTLLSPGRWARAAARTATDGTAQERKLPLRDPHARAPGGGQGTKRLT